MLPAVDNRTGTLAISDDANGTQAWKILFCSSLLPLHFQSGQKAGITEVNRRSG